jgi:HK97 gp10 family phage protein
MNLMSLAGFAAKLADLTVAVHEESHRALERAAQIVEAEAKSEIGHLQDEAGPFAAWAALKDATVEEKVRLGLPPDINAEGSPLERTGEMRDSIEHTVVSDLSGGVAHVGSNDLVAEYQELGTEHIPPRSFLGGSLFRKEEEVRRELGRYVYGALIGQAVHEQKIDVIGKD